MLSFISQWGFAVITIIYFILLGRQLKRSSVHASFSKQQQQRVLSIFIGSLITWTVVASALSLSGFLDNFNGMPPRFAILIVVPLTSVIFLMRSKTARDLLLHTPPQDIIKLQSFRIFVEMLLWALFVVDLVPIQMTFEGRNFDVLSGLSAPIIAWLVMQQKISPKAIIVWNIVCLALLLNIVTTALLSTPTPFRMFMNEPANTIVAKFPVVCLPALLVPLAYGLNLLSIKQMMLLIKKEQSVENHYAVK